ncbi:MAG: TRAP transporter substrate-binding protein [Firmicutes bacterium]|jgi:tripartite ATP-independent transporter DctP family solute receptor|nr:TRAP transporter substrate-binding protein [Bacillota bacterium]
MRKRALLLLVVGVVGLLFAQTATSATRVFRLAEVHPDGYPTTEGDKYFAKLVNERSGGRLKIEVYFGGTLGPEKDTMEMTKMGAIDAVRTSCSPLVEMYAPIGVFSMPYLFRDEAHMWKVLNGEVGQHFLKAVESAGFVGLTYYDSGARHFYTKKLVKSPADLRGMKIRVQQSSVMLDLVNSMGASAVPMAFNEVYSALQTGVIDGAENNSPSYLTTSHYEVAKFYALDGHTRIPEVILFSKRIWDTLPPADQALIRQAALDSTAFQREAWKKFEDEALAKVKASGCTITEVNISEFQKAVESMYAKYPQYSEWVEKIRAVK